MEQKYRKHTHREHILALPDTYIGSIDNGIEDVFVVDDSGDRFVAKSLMFNPGFYKLVDELLVNAHDHVIRLQQRKSKNPVKHIGVWATENTITIRNDGESIDVDIHPEYGIPIPQLIFAELLTSTNYDTEEKKLVGGKNGYGVKLVNIFAKSLTLTIVDDTRQKKYVQTFTDNMSVIEKPSITSCKGKPYVEIVWTPDLKRFGWNSKIPSELLEVVRRRVYDLAMTAGKDVRVAWCDTTIRFRDLASYASRYLKDYAPIVADIPVAGWQLAVADSPTDRFFSVSFVNGIWTRSGKHVDTIRNQIVAHFVSYFEKKKMKVRPSQITDSISVFLNCSIENPCFSSQTKEVMTSPVSCKLSDDFLKKLVVKLGIVSKVMESQVLKEAKDASKTDGKKQSRITGIPKLDDASFAGTARSHECTLILTEGDSAKSMAISGLSQEQRKVFGVYPLRGKMLNVKDAPSTQVSQNAEIVDLKKILGLESGKKYDSVRSLRYGRVLIMTDQDYDGAHIRGLVINVFHELWHELIAIPDFLAYMATPIVKAHKGKETLNFYTQYEYEQWRVNAKGWNVKYYKGLGTSTRTEALEYFKRLRIIPYGYTPHSDDKLELAFNKKKADERKKWLQGYDASAILPGDAIIPYETFVDRDLIHFSNYNLERAIPSVMDGLKTSQRKILYSAFKRRLISEIKVAQFAGYVSEHSGYHHGEASLNETIVGMAHDFVGSNNLPWFVPQGQFGSRLAGGSDSASPRYIHTYLQPHVATLVPREDFSCLKYREDDGSPVEPDWYAPLLPMILVNGCRGIGTGYSTYIPCYNPADLKRIILQWLETAKGLDTPLVPWYRGFTGSISPSGNDFVVSGRWKQEKTGFLITELPIETWTSSFRESLDKMGLEYTDTSTDTRVNVLVKITDISILEKLLVGKIKTTNLHAFNARGVIHKYASPNEILKEYCSVRLALYETRRQALMTEIRGKIPYHENVVRFIRQQCEVVPRPDIRRKLPDEIDTLLESENFARIGSSFEYLLQLPIMALTLKRAQKYEAELAELRSDLDVLEDTNSRVMWHEELSSLDV